MQDMDRDFIYDDRKSQPTTGTSEARLPDEAPRRTHSTIDARPALLMLQSIRDCQPLGDELLAKKLGNAGYLTNAPATEGEAMQAAVDEARKAKQTLQSLRATLAQQEERLDERSRQAGSLLYALNTFAWLGSGSTESARQDAAQAQAAIADLRKKEEQLLDVVMRGGAARSWLSSFQQVGNSFYTLSESGQRLLQELSPRENLLGGLSVDDVERTVERLNTELVSMKQRLEALMQAFKEVGVDTSDRRTAAAIIRAGIINAPLRDVVRAISEWDRELKSHKLTQAERITLSAQLVAAGVDAQDNSSALQLMITRLTAFNERKKGATFPDVGAAVALLTNKPNQSTVAEYQDCESMLHKLGIKKQTGLFAHCASRLASEGRETREEFVTLFNKLTPLVGKDLVTRATVSLALFSGAGDSEERLSKFAETWKKSQSASAKAKLHPALIASLCMLPGGVEPHLHVIGQIQEMLRGSKTLTSEMDTAVMLYSGAMKTAWINNDTELLQMMGAKNISESTRIRSERSLHDNSFSSSSTGYYDGGYVYPWSFDSGAPCGTSSPESSGGSHGHCSGSAGSHCSSAGHSSCSTGSTSSCSSSASSCGSSSSCGGSSCGGGGCGS